MKHRFTVEEYHRMGGAGIFTEDDRVELIEGDALEMTPTGSRHAAHVDRLADALGQHVTVEASPDLSFSVDDILV